MGVEANETPTLPVYLYHAPNDEVIPYDDAFSLRDRWCNLGADVTFVNIASGGHATTEILGFPGAFEFVEAAFAGTAGNGGSCSERTVLDDTLNPLALGVRLETILVRLLNDLAIAGREDINIINDPATLQETID